MYLLYIDASGTADVPGDLPLYVLLGLCLHEGRWFGLERRLKQLKGRYAHGPRSFELHAKDFCVDYPEQISVAEFVTLDYAARRSAMLSIRKSKLSALSGDARQARKRKYRQTDSFAHLTRQQRSQLYTEALDLVGDHEGVRLFGEVFDKRTLPIVPGRVITAEDVVQRCFTQIVSRFDAFLRRQNSRSSRAEKGLLIMDNDPSHAQRFERLLESYRVDGHPWGVVQNVIETPFFVDSASAGGVQLADVCAYSVRRYVSQAGMAGSHEEQNFLRAFHKFDRSGPRLHGLRHYCQKGSCSCLICADRGHVSSQGDESTDGIPPTLLGH